MRSVRAVRPATLSRKYMKDVFHVMTGGLGGLFRRGPVFARVDIRGIPVPPVVSGVGLLVLVVALGCLVRSSARVATSIGRPTTHDRDAWSLPPGRSMYCRRDL